MREDSALQSSLIPQSIMQTLSPDGFVQQYTPMQHTLDKLYSKQVHDPSLYNANTDRDVQKYTHMQHIFDTFYLRGQFKVENDQLGKFNLFHFWNPNKT